MSTGASSARRDARQQRILLQQQQRETQKALAEEKDLESRNRRGIEASKKGRGSLLQQQGNLKSLLGARDALATGGGGDVGSSINVNGSGFLEPSLIGYSADQTRKGRVR